MLREFLKIFRFDDAIARMGEDFNHMLDLSMGLTVRAGRVFFERAGDSAEREQIAKADVEVNRLERRIRKQVIAHLTLSTSSRDASYCLMLMSLVKDVERLGDYATNVAEVHDEGGGPLPDDEFAAELREIRTEVEATFAAVSSVFAASDSERAVELIKQGRTTTLVLGARYYKRIQAHLLNILSAVVMPLHKLDYFDEKALRREGGS